MKKIWSNSAKSLPYGEELPCLLYWQERIETAVEATAQANQELVVAEQQLNKAVNSSEGIETAQLALVDAQQRLEWAKKEQYEAIAEVPPHFRGKNRHRKWRLQAAIAACKEERIERQSNLLGNDLARKLYAG